MDQDLVSAIEKLADEQRRTNGLLHNLQQLAVIQLTEEQKRQFSEFQVDEIERIKREVGRSK